MEQSTDITALCEALAAFQGEVCGAPKGGKNPHLKNAYTRLEDAILATQEARDRHGLAVVQFPTGEANGSIGVTTRLTHKSGQWMESTFAMPISSGKGTTGAQQVGSALSYARRYAYLAVLGLATVDDDGEGTRTRGAKKVESSPRLHEAGAHLDKITTLEELSVWTSMYGDLPEHDKQKLRGRLGEVKASLTGAA
jgi:hypothetical protein